MPNCLYKQCGLCQTLAFVLGVWNFGMCWVEGTQAEDVYKTSSDKNPGCGVSNELAWQTRFHMYYYTSLLEELSVSCVKPLEEESWKLVPGFLQTLFHLLFPFADFVCILLLQQILGSWYD